MWVHHLLTRLKNEFSFFEEIVIFGMARPRPLINKSPPHKANHRTHRHTKVDGMPPQRPIIQSPRGEIPRFFHLPLRAFSPRLAALDGTYISGMPGFAISSCDCDGCTQRTETSLPGRLGRFILRPRTEYAVHCHCFLFPMFFFGRPSNG